ncbi:MAG: DUF1127 domain-containing protein [Hyphomicrobiaceae bacterium]
MFFTPTATSLPRPQRSFVQVIAATFGWLDLVLKVRRERRELAALDDRMLADIGLSRSLVHAETARDLLDLPRDRMHRHGR